MLHDLPCGNEKVIHHAPENLPRFKERLLNSKWFGFAQVDIEIPKILSMKFEGMPPFFFTKHIPDEAVPQHMKDYCRRTGGPEATEKSWSVRWRQKKLLLYAPLLRWYVEHGAASTAVHRTIDY